MSEKFEVIPIRNTCKTFLEFSRKFGQRHGMHKNGLDIILQPKAKKLRLNNYVFFMRSVDSGLFNN